MYITHTTIVVLSGRQAASALVELLGNLGVVPDVVDIPQGMDLNDWAHADPTWAHEMRRQIEPRSHEFDLDRPTGRGVEREGISLEL